MQIRFRLLLAFAMVILVMVIGVFLSLSVSRQILGNAIGQNHVVQTQRIMEKVDREVYYRVEEIRGYGRDVLLRETVERSNRAMAQRADRETLIRQREQEWSAAGQEAEIPFVAAVMESPLAEELREKKEFYTQEWLRHPVYPDLLVTNRYGVVVAATDRPSHYLLADEPWYREALGQKEFWLGNLGYDDRAGIYSCDIVVKIFDEEQAFAGLFKARLNLETIQSLLAQEVERHMHQTRYDQEVHLKLLTADHRLIYTCEAGYAVNEDLTGRDFVRRIGQGGSHGFFVLSGDRPQEGAELFAYARSGGYRDYAGLGWLLLYEQGLAEVYAPVDSLSRHMLAITAVMVLAALLFTHYFSRSFARLVTELGATTRELDGRVKELNCLYGISKLADQEEGHSGAILQGAVDLLRDSWREPARICARIVVEGEAYQSADFRETPWRLSREIRVAGRAAGAVEVFSLEEGPKGDEGPFRKEERYRLDAIAELLGNVLGRFRMAREKQQIQGLMFQQEKLASVGQLAAGVAHEINNPTGFIACNLGTMKKYVARLMEYVAASAANPAPEELLQLRQKLRIDFIAKDIGALVDESLEGTERVKEIVRNLKSFSRVDEAQCKEANVNDCLENTIKVVWNELKYKARVVKELGELPPIKCYPQQLNQVFMNLLVNAVQAIEKEGEIRIRTWQEGDHVFVAVSDTGQGIPAENVNKLFEPFFTTKEVGKGTGLGLSISHEIVQKHHGRIEVQSEVGKGTTFTVILPCHGTV